MRNGSGNYVWYLTPIQCLLTNFQNTGCSSLFDADYEGHVVQSPLISSDPGLCVTTAVNLYKRTLISLLWGRLMR